MQQEKPCEAAFGGVVRREDPPFSWAVVYMFVSCFEASPLLNESSTFVRSRRPPIIKKLNRLPATASFPALSKDKNDERLARLVC